MSKRSRHRLANCLAGLLYHYVDLRKELARNNLKMAFPKWSDKKINLMLKKIYFFFSQNFIDFISIPKSWEGIKIDVIGKDILESSLHQGKGVIFITGHFGCWEILGKWLGENTPLFTGIAQRQKNRGANKFFQEQREIAGTKHIFRKEPIEKMYDVLSENGILGLVSDQDAKTKGVFVNFFGSPASTPKGAAIFHIKTSAPMMIGTCIKKAFMHYEIRFCSIDTSSQNLTDITQNYTTILENHIRKNPEQYFWFHRRWKTRP